MTINSYINFFLPQRILILLYLLTALPLFSSGGIEQEVAIKPYRVVVDTWEGPWDAHVMVFEDGSRLNWIWGITGFKSYTDGTEYRLKIRKKHISNPPVDTPDTEYVLVEIIEEKEVPEIENIEMKIGNFTEPFLRYRNEGDWYLAWKIPVEISPDLSEKEITLALNGSFEPLGVFDVKNGKYILKDIRYDFVPDFFMDRIISVMEKVPDYETVEK